MILAAALFLAAPSAPKTAGAPASGVNVKDYGAVGDGRSDDTNALAKAMKAAGPGATITFPPGTYRVSELTLPGNATLIAPNGATIRGRVVAKEPHTTIRGFTFQSSVVDISGSDYVTIGDSVFRGGGPDGIRMDNASHALIINNDFADILAGGAIAGWAVDTSTVSGNHFVNCLQSISFDFNNDRTRGHDIMIERNIFSGTKRMPIEVGPVDAYTQDMVVRDNWAEDFNNRGPDPGDTMSTFVAYSLVPTNGVRTVITNNYAIAGKRGRGAIGIELAGTGEIAYNYVDEFNYGAIVYGPNFSVHDNIFLDTTIAPVLNDGKGVGPISGNFARRVPPPPKPERRPWPLSH